MAEGWHCIDRSASGARDEISLGLTTLIEARGSHEIISGPA
jgi:hypothetical protein